MDRILKKTVCAQLSFVKYVTHQFQAKLDSWYLNILMVRPDRQGQGIATRFIDIVREKVHLTSATTSVLCMY